MVIIMKYKYVKNIVNIRKDNYLILLILGLNFYLFLLKKNSKNLSKIL